MLPCQQDYSAMFPVTSMLDEQIWQTSAEQLMMSSEVPDPVNYMHKHKFITHNAVLKT